MLVNFVDPTVVCLLFQKKDQIWTQGTFIPDPTIPKSKNPDPHQKELKYFKTKKWFLSSWKYDQGCSSRIRIPDLDPDFLVLPFPDLGSNGSGSRIRIRNTGKNPTRSDPNTPLPPREWNLLILIAFTTFRTLKKEEKKTLLRLTESSYNRCLILSSNYLTWQSRHPCSAGWRP